MHTTLFSFSSAHVSISGGGYQVRNTHTQHLQTVH